jgi:hypothetical protein
MHVVEEFLTDLRVPVTIHSIIKSSKRKSAWLQCNAIEVTDNEEANARALTSSRSRLYTRAFRTTCARYCLMRHVGRRALVMRDRNLEVPPSAPLSCSPLRHPANAAIWSCTVLYLKCKMFRLTLPTLVPACCPRRLLSVPPSNSPPLPCFPPLLCPRCTGGYGMLDIGVILLPVCWSHHYAT